MKKTQGPTISYAFRWILSLSLALGSGPLRAETPKNNVAPTQKRLADLDLSIPEKYLEPDESELQPDFSKVTLNYEVCKKIPQMDLDPLFDLYHDFKEELRIQCRTYLTQPEKFNQQHTIYLPFDVKDQLGQITLPSLTPEQMEQFERHPVYKKFEKALEGKFINTNEQIKKRTKFLIVLCVALMGFLSVLPNDVTNWNRSDEKSTLEWWEYSVTHPPVLDEDRLFFNYVGHPLGGSWYYLLARDAGLTPFQAFVYSAFASTIIWEYGVEAPAERPSIQDLIITPVAGALVGMVAEKILNRIKAKDRKVLGSKILGEVVIFLIDPLTSIITNSQNYLEKTFPNTEPQFQIYYGPISIDPYNKPFAPDPRTQDGRVWMFRLKVPFRFLGS